MGFMGVVFLIKWVVICLSIFLIFLLFKVEVLNCIVNVWVFGSNVIALFLLNVEFKLILFFIKIK